MSGIWCQLHLKNVQVHIFFVSGNDPIIICIILEPGEKGTNKTASKCSAQFQLIDLWKLYFLLHSSFLSFFTRVVKSVSTCQRRKLHSISAAIFPFSTKVKNTFISSNCVHKKYTCLQPTNTCKYTCVWTYEQKNIYSDSPQHIKNAFILHDKIHTSTSLFRGEEMKTMHFLQENVSLTWFHFLQPKQQVIFFSRHISFYYLPAPIFFVCVCISSFSSEKRRRRKWKNPSWLIFVS